MFSVFILCQNFPVFIWIFVSKKEARFTFSVGCYIYYRARRDCSDSSQNPLI